MFKCEICGKEFKIIRGLAVHITKTHISAEEYYLKYINSNKQNNCNNPDCLNKTKFRNIKVGYDKYCSNICASRCNKTPENIQRQINSYKNNNDKEEILKKTKNTKKEKYGDENYNNRIKAKETCNERYGVDYYSSTKEYREKSEKTCIEKFGYKSHNQSHLVKEKKRQTSLKNHGVDWPSKCSIISKKQQDTLLKNNGIDFHKRIANKFWKNITNEEKINIYKKQEETCLSRYGTRKFGSCKEFIEKRKKSLKITLYNKIRQKLKILNLDILQEFNDIREDVQIKCLVCNKIYINKWFNIVSGYGRCPTCNPRNRPSNSENEIIEFIKSFNIEVLSGKKDLIKNPETNRFLELDIFIPSKNIAIEFNGLYWHNEQFRDNKYHLMKYNLCKDLNIKLIQIFEDEWVFKKDIVKNIIKNKLGILNDTKMIHGRKCIIKKINTNDKNIFLQNNHIQGKDQSLIKLGAFYENELVAVMTFSHGNATRGTLTKDLLYWELSRFVVDMKSHIPGIGGKLFHYFKNNFEWNKIISYCDLRYFDGGIYNKLGFKLDKIVEPDYSYTYLSSGLKRIHRYALRKKLDEPKDIPEYILREAQGFIRIWDAGKYKFVYEK
jgi:hypothetical protein